MGSYRRRLDIIADILRVVSQNAKKTQIMYQANLSYRVLQRYLRHVTEASLVDFEDEAHCYVLTQKGQEFLKVYKEYDETNKSVEKRIHDVNNKRKNLEALCESQ